MSALKLAKKEGKQFNIYVTESRPSDQGFIENYINQLF